MVRVFSKVSVPPWLCGMMWSTSALFGLRVYSQSNQMPQVGQRVSPLSKSCCLRWSRTLIHLVVPVRDEFGCITVTSLVVQVLLQ